MGLEKIWKKFTRKKEEPTIKADLHYGLKQFNEMEEDGLFVEEAHITVDRFPVAVNHIWRAWNRGYENFSVTYIPRPDGGLSVDGINRRLGHLDEMGVQYTCTFGKDGEITMTIKDKMEAI